MNNNACNDATDRPLYLNNEVNLDAAVFAIAAPAPTVSAATALTSNIIPDSHILPSGQKPHTKILVHNNIILKKIIMQTVFYEIRKVHYKWPPPPGYFLYFVFEKDTFEVDNSLNTNTLTETKNGNSKIKNQKYERRRSW